MIMFNITENKERKNESEWRTFFIYIIVGNMLCIYCWYDTDMKWVVTVISIVDRKTKTMTTKHGNKYATKRQHPFTILNNKGTTLCELTLFRPLSCKRKQVDNNSPGVFFFFSCGKHQNRIHNMWKWSLFYFNLLSSPPHYRSASFFC